MPRPIHSAHQTASSSTTSITTTEQEAPTVNLPSTARLVLRAEPAEERHIQWAEDVVDNEGMGKKSSKVCCIYHRPRTIGESSDSEDSSSSSSSDESDSDDKDDRAGPIGGAKDGTRKTRARRKRPHHEHDHDHDHARSDGEGRSGKDGNGHKHPKRKSRRKPSPNAYEKMPKYTPTGKKQSDDG